MTNFHFMVERLSNGAWHVGWLEGDRGDYGRILPERAGFSTYEEAEKYATGMLRKLMRKHRDALAQAEQDALNASRLKSALANR